MRKVKMHCGVSLDGRLAGPKHELGWLPAPETGDGDAYGIEAFNASCDVAVMVLLWRAGGLGGSLYVPKSAKGVGGNPRGEGGIGWGVSGNPKGVGGNPMGVTGTG